MPEKHPDYWKVKAAYFEAQHSTAQARAAVMDARARFARVIQQAGLDPNVDYQLEDADESITPRDTSA